MEFDSSIIYKVSLDNREFDMKISNSGTENGKNRKLILFLVENFKTSW